MSVTITRSRNQPAFSPVLSCSILGEEQPWICILVKTNHQNCNFVEYFILCKTRATAHKMLAYTCLPKIFHGSYGLLQSILKITTFHIHLWAGIISTYVGRYLKEMHTSIHTPACSFNMCNNSSYTSCLKYKWLSSHSVSLLLFSLLALFYPPLPISTASFVLLTNF